jgi:predicted enzyme involved in methoxymalonyl-ACP biosynthesis
MLAQLARGARELGCRHLIGEYIPTDRNHVVAGLYSQMGFAKLSDEANMVRYALDLSSQDIQTPTYMKSV